METLNVYIKILTLRYKKEYGFQLLRLGEKVRGSVRLGASLVRWLWLSIRKKLCVQPSVWQIRILFRWTQACAFESAHYYSSSFSTLPSMMPCCILVKIYVLRIVYGYIQRHPYLCLVFNKDDV